MNGESAMTLLAVDNLAMPSWRQCTSRGDMAPASGHQWLVTITRLGRGRIGHMALSPWCTPRASKCTSTSSLRVWDGLFQLGELGRPIAYLAQAASLTDDSIRFVPSAATTDCCSMDEDGKHVTVSNARIYT